MTLNPCVTVEFSEILKAIRVLHRFKIFVQSLSAPAKLEPAPHPHKFEKSCPHPHTSNLLLPCIPCQPAPALPHTFSVSNPHLSENYQKLATRASFGCNKIVRNIHLFLTKVAFMHKHFKQQ